MEHGHLKGELGSREEDRGQANPGTHGGGWIGCANSDGQRRDLTDTLDVDMLGMRLVEFGVKGSETSGQVRIFGQGSQVENQVRTVPLKTGKSGRGAR
jgi:hypothetical protein